MRMKIFRRESTAHFGIFFFLVTYAVTTVIQGMRVPELRLRVIMALVKELSLEEVLR